MEARDEILSELWNVVGHHNSEGSAYKIVEVVVERTAGFELERCELKSISEGSSWNTKSPLVSTNQESQRFGLAKISAD